MPKQHKRVFIAYSSEAMPVAYALKDKLHKRLQIAKQEIRITEWSDSSKPSENLIKTILDHACKTDFAIVLLTQDDLLEKKGKKFDAPRDNTIFELGLFIGALGRTTSRCFMVCGAERGALPSDLDGCTLISISGKNPKEDECADSIEDAAAKISAVIEDTDHYRHPRLCTLNKEELRWKEQAEKDGGDLDIKPEKVAVVVNSEYPIEQLDSEFSVAVLNNMEIGAKYEYFYGDFDENISDTLNLVVWIATAGLMQPDIPLKQLLPRMLETSSKILENLSIMRENLSIHFKKRPPLQFCVHNATTPDKARCYLRYEDEFVPWRQGKEAKIIAADLLDSCAVDPSDRDSCIFHSTRDVLLNERRLNEILTRGSSDKSEAAGERAAKERAAIAARRSKILRLISKRFPPELHKSVGEICLGS